MADGGAIDSPGGKIPGIAEGFPPGTRRPLPLPAPDPLPACFRGSSRRTAPAGGPATLQESDNKTLFRKLLDTSFPVGVQE